MVTCDTIVIANSEPAWCSNLTVKCSMFMFESLATSTYNLCRTICHHMPRVPAAERVKHVPPCVQPAATVLAALVTKANQHKLYTPCIGKSPGVTTIFSQNVSDQPAKHSGACPSGAAAVHGWPRPQLRQCDNAMEGLT